MKAIFRAFPVCLISICFILSGIEISQPQALQDAIAQIKIENADALWEVDLVASADLTVAVSTVPVRIVIEYASSVRKQDIAASKELSEVARPVPPRIIMEYADSIFTREFLEPEGLDNTAIVVSPRIILEYANASLSRDLVRFFDEDGTIPPMPSSTSSFTLSLDNGLNMCSLPLRPNVSLTARSFAQQLGATMVIKYDAQQDEFVPFVPEVFTGDGFPIGGGEGYIVNMLSSREVTFTGTAWSNAPAKSAPSKPMREPHWAFGVCGAVYDKDMLLQSSDIGISVENHRTGNNAETWVGRLENGKYAIAFVDQNRKDVVDQGDVLGVQLRDTRTGAISKLIKHTVTPLDIMRSYVELPMRLDYFTPEKNALLQNYPNPFNPDTWIPYQLSEDSHLIIKIHAATGQLIRTLDLGHKSAGFYANRERAAHWDGRNEVGEQVASGIYFYSIKAGTFTGTGKMTVAR